MQQVLIRFWRLGRALLSEPRDAGARPTPRGRKRTPRKPRDSQRGQVYRWEAVHVFPRTAEQLSLERCRNLVELVYRWHKAPGGDPNWAPPRVEDGHRRRHACGSRATIKLPRWARTPAVVLHECAHGA